MRALALFRELHPGVSLGRYLAQRVLVMAIGLATAPLFAALLP